MNSRQRGFALLDLMMTLSLVGIVFTMAALLLDRVWKTERNMVEVDHALRNVDHLMTQLGREIGQARVIKTSPDQLVLDEQTVWVIDGSTLERRRDNHSQRWTLKKQNLRFESAPYGVRLSGDDLRLALVNTLQWSRQAGTR